MELKVLDKKDFPENLLGLNEIPDSPEKIYIAGNLPEEDTTLITFVGSRKYTNYGKDVCEYIIKGLKGYNVAIVSGLAIGIDAIAHRTALDVGLKTIAVPGSGLNPDVLYPRENIMLAREIINKGGCLLSEFEPDFKATTWSFPKRNRIMAGLSRAVVIVEAEEKSGTLITARLALDYSKDVFVVPGSIFSQNSKGVNYLLREGATPIMSGEDLLVSLGLANKKEKMKEDFSNLNENERKIMEILTEPKTRKELLEISDMKMENLNQTISILEIKDLVKEEVGKIRRC